MLAAVYLIWAPPSADLAAQTYRTEFFEAHPFAIWTNDWYSGVHLPGYSLIFPPLASVFGVRLVGAIAAVVAAPLFAAIVGPLYGRRAMPAILALSAGCGATLFSGRLTFALGVAIGLGAILAIERRRLLLGVVLAALSSAGSPVAGLFVAFAGAVYWLEGRRRDGYALVLPGFAVILVSALFFPTGGIEPFKGDTFVLISAAIAIVFIVAPAEDRTIHLGAGLYGLMCLALFAIHTPVGGNATRLGALMAAPLLLLASAGKRPAWLVAVAVLPLFYWQWVAPVRDLSDAVGEPSVERAYYDPLVSELATRAPDTPFRVEVPPTRNRWEAVYVAERFPLARGWMRQLESDDFGLFEHGHLTADEYRRWLDERGVAFVAISRGARPDYLSRDEIDLIHAGLPYLREVWSNDDWQLYAVSAPAPLAEAPAALTDLGANSFAIAAPAGTYRLSVNPSRWWRVTSGDGCVSADGDDAVQVRLDKAGELRAEAELSLSGLFGRGGC